MTTETPLHLVQIRLRERDLDRWAINNRCSLEDTGYALHSFTAFAFGTAAPRPFTFKRIDGDLIVLGYSFLDSQGLRELCSLAARPDTSRLVAESEIEDKRLPDVWPEGMTLGFEIRATPVLRSRRNGAERDIFCAARETDPEADKESVYTSWLADRLGAAAEIKVARLADSRMIKVSRRTHRGKNDLVDKSLPDATIRGNLTITDGELFGEMIRNGIGRHKSFGFGMLLLAPAKPSHLTA